MLASQTRPNRFFFNLKLNFLSLLFKTKKNKTKTDRFSVGQNVAATWTFDKPSPTGEEPEFKRQIEAWFNEVTQIGFRPKDIDPFNFNRQAGHYSQVRPCRCHLTNLFIECPVHNSDTVHFTPYPFQLSCIFK